MTPKEAAQHVVEIWNSVTHEIHENVSPATPMEARIAMFEQANDWMIHENITREHKEAREAKEQKQEEPVSQKQLDYIMSLGGFTGKVKTKKEASAYIEDLRKQ